MAKKFITMPELMEEFKELKKLDKVVSKIDWKKDREKYFELMKRSPRRLR